MVFVAFCAPAKKPSAESHEKFQLGPSWRLSTSEMSDEFPLGAGSEDNNSKASEGIDDVRLTEYPSPHILPLLLSSFQDIKRVQRSVEQLNEVVMMANSIGSKGSLQPDHSPRLTPLSSSASTSTTDQEQQRAERDSRSIHVSNVDYSTTPEELKDFFSACGPIEKITILCDKMTGRPKGFAYVEFKNVEDVTTALILDQTEFKGRQLKIQQKRSNLPGMAATSSRGGRGRGGFVRGGFRGRGRGRGGFGGMIDPTILAYALGMGMQQRPRQFGNRRYDASSKP